MTSGLLLLTLCLGAGAVSDGGVLPDHPPVSATGAGGDGGAQGAMSADEVMKRLDASADLKKRPKTFDVAGAMGRLYYAHGRYEDAQGFLGEAIGKAQGLSEVAKSGRKKMGAGAYAQLKPALPSDCGFSPGAPMETLAPLIQAKAKADAKLGAACARTALKEVGELRLLEAQAQFIQKEPAAALKSLTKLLELWPEQADARYARGYILFDSKGDDLAALKAAKADIDSYLKRASTGVRADEAKQISSQIGKAIAAGGVTALDKKWQRPRPSATAPAAPPFAAGEMDPHAPTIAGAGGGGSPPPLTQEMIDAVQNTERTPELERKFAETVEQGEALLAKGQYQEALDAYKRVIPFQPNNGRAKAGMAWALVGLNRQPMAERIWGVAVSSDAAAVDRLGDALKAKGDAKGATALWSKLAQSSPDYAKSSGLQAKLK